MRARALLVGTSAGAASQFAEAAQQDGVRDELHRGHVREIHADIRNRSGFDLASLREGAAFVLPWSRVAAVVALVLASIAYDFYLLGSAQRDGDLEWAELIALAAIGTSLLTAAASTYYLRPGNVASALVRRRASSVLRAKPDSVSDRLIVGLFVSVAAFTRLPLASFSGYIL